ncbi:MAG: outer membrane protein transport protein, partial [Proteobacteria bacterium]|nr:outer membrane protein transport protein [Pseudomonadota bacterium]
MERSVIMQRRFRLFILCLVFMSCTGSVNSALGADFLSRIEIPSSPNPVGSGARALGMGGAFIAVADDATAASWNPGGLVQLETPEVSAVGAYFHRTEDNTFGTNPEASGDQSVSEASLNYLSMSYPFTLFDRNMVVSFNYQNLYDFSRDWQFPLSQPSETFSINQNIDYQQDGTLSAYGLAYSIQVIPELSFGFTLNIWQDGIYKNKWKQITKTSGSGTFYDIPFVSESNSTDEYSFTGLNANLGVMWNITGQLTLGAVFKTPFTADL